MNKINKPLDADILELNYFFSLIVYIFLTKFLKRLYLSQTNKPDLYALSSLQEIYLLLPIAQLF